MTRVSALLLAAGESRRMGRANKLALPVDGEPLLRRTARILLQADSLQEVVAVLGHERAAVRGLLDGLPLRLVDNPDPGRGRMSSVYHGIEALQGQDTAVMVCLADQPLLQAEDINRLLAVFREEPEKVLLPVYQGRRGNPVLIPAGQREAVLGEGPERGCRHFIDENPQLVRTYEWDNDHLVFDLDTPADWEELAQKKSTGSNDWGNGTGAVQSSGAFRP